MPRGLGYEYLIQSEGLQYDRTVEAFYLDIVIIRRVLGNQKIRERTIWARGNLECGGSVNDVGDCVTRPIGGRVVCALIQVYDGHSERLVLSVEYLIG